MFDAEKRETYSVHRRNNIQDDFVCRAFYANEKEEVEEGEKEDQNIIEISKYDDDIVVVGGGGGGGGDSPQNGDIKFAFKTQTRKKKMKKKRKPNVNIFKGQRMQSTMK